MDSYKDKDIIVEDATYQEEFPPIRAFEWIYFFVMVIYMAQMTPDTARMVGQLSGNPIPFLIPIFLTAILLARNPISFNNRQLLKVTGIAVVWSAMIIVKYSMTTTEEFSYLFFLFYTIFTAYIHIKVFGENLFYMYEKVMVLVSIIAIVMWIPTIIAPSAAQSLYSFGEETTYGRNILYLFNYMDPSKGQVFRNAGISWEPGRFAIMLALAIYCNLLQQWSEIINNKKLWILVTAMLTTQSTTGYSVTLIIILLFYTKNLSFGKSLLLTVIAIPFIIYIFSLDFMGEKIGGQVDDASNSSSINFEYTNKKHNEGEYAYSLDRFPSMVFEFENIKKDPILGYSKNHDHSFFYQNISNNVRLTGGFLRIFGEYGVIFGIIFYLFLIKSSQRASQVYESGNILTLFLTMLFCSISYPVFGIPIFSAFWFYGTFSEDEYDKDMVEYESFTEEEHPYEYTAE